MVTINKRQKQILSCLNNIFPNCLSYEVLLAQLGHNPGDIVFLEDLQLKGFVDINRTCFVYPDGAKSHEVPADSWITLKGRKKLQETIFKRLMLLLIVFMIAIIVAMIKINLILRAS
ncbi:MAG: hypothetical protein WA144_03530 [Candidatus Methanoperedens sp.]